MQRHMRKIFPYFSWLTIELIVFLYFSVMYENVVARITFTFALRPKIHAHAHTTNTYYLYCTCPHVEKKRNETYSENLNN